MAVLWLLQPANPLATLSFVLSLADIFPLFSVYHVKLAKETFSSLRDDDLNRKYWMCILDLKMDPS